MSNTCLLERPSQLRDTIILGGSSLKIRVATSKLVTTNNHETPMHLGFHLLRCGATKATSFCSLMCICDRRAGLWNCHPQQSCTKAWQIMFLGSYLCNYSIRFSKFIIITCLPLRQSRTEPHRIYRELY
jgi:hypothetical protein